MGLSMILVTKSELILPLKKRQLLLNRLPLLDLHLPQVVL